MANRGFPSYVYASKPIPRFYFKGNLAPFIIISSLITVIIVILFYCEGSVFYVITGMIISYVIFSSSKYSISVCDKHLIWGDELVFYDNIQSIVVDEKDSQCFIRTFNNKQYVIDAEKFKTNARKPYKIKKNKRDKFYKVVGRILDAADQMLPANAVTVKCPQRFKRFQ